MGPAYQFAEYVEPSRHLLAITQSNAEMLRGGFEELVAELPDWQPFVAIVEDSRAVSCLPQRFALPRRLTRLVSRHCRIFRGKGYAQDAVAGWARAVASLGCSALIQYILGEYCLTEGREKTAAGTVRC